MSTNLVYVAKDKNFSYQHLHGVMFVNLNKIASKERLSHSEYRIMGILIGLWNKNTNYSFPSINYLVEMCRMSKSTVINNLKNLESKGLIIVNKSKGKRNNYYFSNLILNYQENTKIVPPTIPSCSTKHDIKQIKIITNKKTSSLNNNDDEINQLNQKLNQWGVSSSNKIITQYGVNKVKLAIDLTIKQNPNNYGAYFRTIIQSNITPLKQDLDKTNLINLMLMSKFWKHKPSNNVLRVKPDIGEHLYIKYNKDINTVIFLETGLTDILTNFECVDNDFSLDNINKKPSKKKVIEDITKSGNIKEAAILNQLWRFKQ
ncbi:MAG: helix-turn-helix domain-containing protein [Vampirovibrionia bacterium]